MEKKLREKYLRCRSVSYPKGKHRTARKEDLKRYLELARELGVSDAAVVKKGSWFLDPRVTLKCTVPRCRNYDTCSNCPPHTPNWRETAALIEPYRTAVLLRWVYVRDVAPEIAASRRRSTYSTLADIEAAAFYDGYYFACGFGAGSCRYLCGGEICRELVEPEKGCRHPLLARPSMEAMGFDVYRTASAAGWTMNPAGGGCPADVKTLSRISIVLIA